MHVCIIYICMIYVCCMYECMHACISKARHLLLNELYYPLTNFQTFRRNRNKTC